MDCTFLLPDGRIIEFKTSPESRYIAARTIKDAIRNLGPFFAHRGRPPGYIFIFPINEIAGEVREVLETFKDENQDVEILWFDCHAFENIIESLGLDSEDAIINFAQKNKDAMDVLKRAQKRSQNK